MNPAFPIQRQVLCLRITPRGLKIQLSARKSFEDNELRLAATEFNIELNTDGVLGPKYT
jgi:hypothetical protein